MRENGEAEAKHPGLIILGEGCAPQNRPALGSRATSCHSLLVLPPFVESDSSHILSGYLILNHLGQEQGLHISTVDSM